MDLETVRKAYRRYAAGYDLYFGAVLQQGRHKVVECMDCRPGERILEVGVGTGLSLPLYPDDVAITGIDISPEMLQLARTRTQRLGLEQVAGLHCMDAEAMNFPDDAFDKVAAMYVVSVVPHPARLVSEMRRVCRPGGDLYIVNHFMQGGSLINGLERFMGRFSGQVGFRPDFALDDFLSETGLEVAEHIPVNLFGYWSLLRVVNDKPASGSDDGDSDECRPVVGNAGAKAASREFSPASP